MRSDSRHPRIPARRITAARVVVAVAVAVSSGTLATLTAAPARATPQVAAARAAAFAPLSAIAAAVDPCGPSGNKVTCENSKPGTSPDIWDDQFGAGSEDIQGYATQISTNVGGRVDFKIDTDASNYAVTIYRLGYYNGDGARKIADVTPSATLPQHQPQCITDVTTEMYDCGNWAVSASWTVPSTAVSGVYIARLEIPSSGAASQITFVVRDDSSTSQVVFQTSDPTWVAYNLYGGSSFYQGGANGRTYKASYNRPIMTRGGTGGRDFFFANEYPLVRFMERNGYDVSYISGVDTARNGALLKNHKVFVSVGHDEYWSGAQRANVQAARDAGVNLMFLSGNEVYWRTRYEASADASHTAYRTLVSYKETWNYGKIDPSPEWTGTWRDPRYAPQSQGAGLPENALSGTMYMSNSDDLAVTVSEAEGKLRLWRNTSLTSMTPGTTRALAPHTVGYESDEDVDNGFRPAGLIRLSTTTGSTPEYLTDFGNTVVPGTTTHHLTMYRAASGALVFSAGSIQWTWGLDEVHDSPYPAEPADVRMQQAQVNLFADMGAQPATLMTGLVAATKSTDTVGPSTTINSPTAGASLANGALLTVTGTAADTGGGRVAGVEVSMDNGDTWHPATGTSSWTYSAVQHGIGAQSIRVRATDDSANIGAVATRSVSVTCPCSAFGATVPKVTAMDDSSAVELGLTFSPDVTGFVTGVRFYKGAGNGGSHTGRVWSSTGTLLGTATFSNETATGWQTASFVSPVPVTAGQSYVVSYSAPQGHYAVQENAFSTMTTKASPFTIAGGFGAPAAGVYGAVGAFPVQTSGDANYFVDPVFSTTDTSPLTVTAQAPLAAATSVPTGTTVKATFSKPVTAASVSITVKNSAGTAIGGTTTYDSATRVATFTPSAPLAGAVVHSVTAKGTDAGGQQVSAGGSWSFTTAQPAGAAGVCPCSLFGDDTQPVTLEESDTDPVTLGVRFTVDTPGTVSAIRFFKGPNNTGSHTGTLWSGTGTQLATGTFGSESTSGWQTLTFATPVSVTTGTEYVASYRAPAGRYSTGTTFSSGDLSRAPLHVGASAGAFTYGTGFPGSPSSANYLVDVVFNKPAASIAITGQDPPPNALDVPLNNPVRVWFSTGIKPTATLTAKIGTTAVAGTQLLDTGATRLTFTPSTNLPADSTVTVTLAGVQSTDGANLADRTWTFKTASTAATAPQTIFGDAVPAVTSSDDSSPVELGTAFTPTRNGVIKALRFHKGTGNGGTHVGSLWSSSGTRLAQVTFTNETPTGWQRAVLATPVSVTAGQTYVVSYLAPQGHYSATAGYFNSPVTSGQLTAPATNNGRYLYGAAGGFPTSSYGATSYFVDVEFVPDAPTITVSGKTPAGGATGVALDARPTISFSNPVAAGFTFTANVGSTAIDGTATLSTDAKKLTFTPTAALPADADVTMTASGVVSQDGATLATQTWTFHTVSTGGVVTTLFDTGTPAVAATDDSSAVELGVSFTPSVNGQVTAIRFYKGAGNGGTHTGTLWSSSGAVLATGTFDTETATGWQTMDLSAPVAVTAGQTYVVSYFAPQGHYAATSGFFAGGYTQGQLAVPAAGNGRYLYGPGGAVPTNTYNNSNYWVGVVFKSG